MTIFPTVTLFILGPFYCRHKTFEPLSLRLWRHWWMTSYLNLSISIWLYMNGSKFNYNAMSNIACVKIIACLLNPIFILQHIKCIGGYNRQKVRIVFIIFSKKSHTPKEKSVSNTNVEQIKVEMVRLSNKGRQSTVSLLSLNIKGSYLWWHCRRPCVTWIRYKTLLNYWKWIVFDNLIV